MAGLFDDDKVPSIPTYAASTVPMFGGLTRDRTEWLFQNGEGLLQ